MKKKLIVLASIALILSTLGCTRKKTTTKHRYTTRGNQSTTKTVRTTTKTKTNTYEPVENKTIYVSNAGDKNKSGTSQLAPTTLDNALNTMDSGDTIYLIEGTYEFEESVIISNSGSEVKRNTIIAEDGVILDFSKTKEDSTLNNGGLVINGSYWQIENITVINSDYYGFRITGRGNRVISCNANSNDYGGFYIKTSLSTFTNCMALKNSMLGYVAYGFYIDGTGENNTFDSCIANDNLDSGFMIVASKTTEFNKCLAFNNGLEGDSGSAQRSGFVFNNKGHIFTNCIAYNNALSGFMVPIRYGEKGSITIVNCEAINNHYRNYSLISNNADTITFTNSLSFNNYDKNDDGEIDAINDYVIGNVINSIFFYNKSYYYEVKNEKFDSTNTSIEVIDFSEFTNEYTINMDIPEEMKQYDPEEKAAIDEAAAEAGIEPDYSSLEYTIIYYKDGVLNIYDYLDRSEIFQDELFEKLELENDYFGSFINPEAPEEPIEPEEPTNPDEQTQVEGNEGE